MLLQHPDHILYSGYLLHPCLVRISHLHDDGVSGAQGRRRAQFGQNWAAGRSISRQCHRFLHHACYAILEYLDPSYTTNLSNAPSNQHILGNKFGAFNPGVSQYCLAGSSANVATFRRRWRLRCFRTFRNIWRDSSHCNRLAPIYG